MALFDHLAVACGSLAADAPTIEALLGVPLEPGGKHAQMGTHNRLLSLGDGEYFELIAIDPEGQTPDRPRWFAMDSFDGPPAVRSWILRCDDMAEALAQAPMGTGTPVPFRRDALTWEFALPDSGVLPFDNCAPALIAWGPGVPHPSTRLPDRGVRLVALTISHPRASVVEAALAPLIDDPRVTVITGAPGLSATFDTPSGRKVL